MARPKLPEDRRKSRLLRIRLTAGERELFARAASLYFGRPQGEVSTWARERLLELADWTIERHREWAARPAGPP